MIKIFDNFLEEDDLEKAIRIVSRSKWGFTQKSEQSEGYTFWAMDLDNEPFYYNYILAKIHEITGKKFELLRVYANGHTYAIDGSFHTDDSRDDCYTFLLYLSNITKDNVDVIGGYTDFKFKNGVHSIEPILNRGVLFNSNILHRGLGPLRQPDILRITVAFKLKLKE